MPLLRATLVPPRWRALSIAMTMTIALAACSRSVLDLETNEGGGSTGTTSSTSSSGSSTSSTSSSSTSSASSSSSGGFCTDDAECADLDACTTDRCLNGGCVHLPADEDNDGHAPIACGGDDCDDHNGKVFPGQQEDCKSGVDDDCNGVADCFDPACASVPDCGCNPSPGGESCTNGKDDDCDGLVDCEDPGCSGNPACGCAGSETQCDDGIDQDCDGLFDCDDPDCIGTDICSCMLASEVCGNGKDDNCDGLVDCKDPECVSQGFCLCTPGAPEVCDNGKDDDCDGLIDCQDPSCAATPACQSCKPEVCDNKKDDDCNGLVDCADPACAFAPNCAPVPEICNNGLDDNHDGNIDCADPECFNNPLCVLQHDSCGTALPIVNSGAATYTGDTTGHVSGAKGSCGGDAGEAVFFFTLSVPTKVHLDSIGTIFDSTLYVRKGACKSGKEVGCDDDSGGDHAAVLDFTLLYPGTYFVFLDGYTVDPNLGANEGPYALNVDFVQNPPEVCDDGIDNDGDHYVDCADPDCLSAPHCFKCNNGKDPGPEFGPTACTDGEDNDCDGAVDGADSDCHASEYYVTEFCNGGDENGNGIIDDFSCRCAGDSDCAELGQICYTHTVFACGIPCDGFFGQICPFVAPGSTCNLTTHQCEF
jgi:hypothetical protein